MMFLSNILRFLCIALDRVVYGLIDMFYQLFMMIAETGIFNTSDIQAFSRRIYFFLGLIMIFKVSISIVQYIMNPDMTKDSKNGAPKLIKNIVIILVGIVIIPYIFEAGYSLQRIVLRDNIIGSLILGMNSSNNSKIGDEVKNAGDNMAFKTLTAFFRLDTDLVDEDGKQMISPECAANPLDSSYNNISDVCKDDEIIDDLEEFLDDNRYYYISAYRYNRIKDLLRYKIYTYTVEVDGEEEYLFSYMYLITTLAGGFVAYILLLFCFDIAKRSVKLGFLQLIAPIPLIAKIDPKKGEETFNKWVKECISTYLDLFFRLIAIYFGIFIISLIGNGMFNVVDPSEKVHNPFVFVFILFGTLLFIKDLPKLLETLLGIKLDGGFSLNPMKNKNLAPIGLAAGAVSSIARGGGIGGVFNALGNFASGKSWGDIVSATNSRNQALALARAQGGNRRQALRQSLSNMFGTRSPSDDIAIRETRIADRERTIEFDEAPGKQMIARNKSVIDAHNSVEERAKKKITESTEYARGQANLEKLKADAERSGSQADYDNYGIAQARFQQWANKTAVCEYIDSNGLSFSKYDGTGSFTASASNDSVLLTAIAARDRIARENGLAGSVVGNANTVSEQVGVLKDTNTTINAGFSRNDTERESIADAKRVLSRDKQVASASSNISNQGWTGKGGSSGK